MLLRLVQRVGPAVGAAVLLGATAAASAADLGPGAALSPDQRPALLLEPPQESLALTQSGRRPRALPSAWRTAEADRGFSQALLMQLSQASANRPWRTFIVSHSSAQSETQLQSLVGQDAVVVAVHDELVDLGGKVQLRVTLDLSTVRAIATPHQTRVSMPLEYLAPALPASTAHPRRSRRLFAADGRFDGQVSTAATDLSQFLATLVARVPEPESLRPHNPTLGERGLHLTCSECRASDEVVYEQPGRIWIRVDKPAGGILALPLPHRQDPRR